MITQADYLAMLQRMAPKAPPPATPQKPGTIEHERDLHEQIRAECIHRGWLAFHGSMAHATHRTIGEPDFVILRDTGRLLLVEAKARQGKLNTEQLALRAWAEKLGHQVHIVRSFQEFLAIL